MTTDISKTIARLAGVLKMPPSLPGYDLVSREDLRALLDAAEAGMRARDAAKMMLTALKDALPQAEGCFINHYGEDPWSVEASEPEYIAKMREAIAAAEGAA